MISVLYVDDEPGLLDIGKLFLEEGGQFRVDTINSATEALTLLNTKNYDAIISDYQMPEMDGIEFLKQVRTSGNTLPFILFTGRGREEVVIQALNEGADFYLQKGGEPVSQFTELAHKIRQAVQKRMAEMSVRDHEQREADIISFLPDATFAIDTHGVVIAWNRAMERMTGVRASEILGKGDHEYSLLCYHERRPALIDMVLREDPDIEAKYPLLKRDGRTLIAEATIPFLNNGRGATIWFTATPLFNTQGTITGAIESVRDITDRKQAEMELSRKHEELEAAYNQLSAQENELKQQMNDISASQSALRESDEKYRDLIKNAGETIFIVQGELLKFVNQRATEVTGYSREELLSRSFLEFVHPDDRAGITANYQHWMRGKLLGVYTFRIVRANGEVRIVEIRAAPILWDGSPATLNFIMDITRQKQAENALQESEERYRNVVEDQTEFICRFLPDGTHVFVNDAYCRYFGLMRDDILGHEFRLQIPDEDRERLKQFFESLTPNRPVDTIEHRIIMPDGSIRWQWWSDRAIFDLSGTIIEYQSVGRDITEQKRVDNEIAFKNILLLTQQETSLDGILIVDENGKIINFNKKFIEIWGIPEDLIVSRIDEPVLQFVTGQLVDPEMFLSRVRYLYNHKDEKSFEEIHLKDGRILERFSAPMLEEGGKYFGRVWYFRDITEQKTLENTLTTSQNMLMAAMDLAHLANWEFDPKTGMFTFDDRFYALFGTTAAREGGYKIPADVYFREFVHPDDYDRIIGEIEQCARISDPHFKSQQEHRIIRRDGEVRYIVVRAGRSTDNHGQKIRIHGVSQDITERKRAEIALQESEQKYRRIFENTSVALFQTRIDGSIVYVNPAFALLLGYETPEQVAVEIPDMKKIWAHPEERDRLFSIRGNQDSLKDVEIAFRRRDGSTVWGCVNLRILHDDDGTITGFEGLAVDITERKRAETALEQARKKLSLLNYVTFNDIQSMIFSLSAYMHLAENPVTNMPMGNITKKERDILQKITHSLNFAKSYQDLGLKPPRWQNVNQVFLLAISHLDFLNMKHTVMLDGLEIFADPLLEQVFQILADNTLIHGKTATQVMVRYAEGPEFLTLIFEDDSMGIPDDAKEKIFSPDFQKTRAIGLFLAREILEITGITIMETGEPGKGVEFEMTVPKGAYRFSATIPQ